MTAIISYYNQKPHKVVIACDDLFTTAEGFDYDDKMFLLFNRFYIADFGPNVLPETLWEIYNFQKFDNCPEPKSVNDLHSMISSLYKHKGFKEKSPKDYQDPDKSQGCVIYDSTEKQLFELDFGRPFWEHNDKDDGVIRINQNGIKRYGLYPLVRDVSVFDISIDNLFVDLKKEVEKEFQILSENLGSSLEQHKVGQLGSYLKVEGDKIEFFSRFFNWCDYIERKYE
jgi:hypothetical protein